MVRILNVSAFFESHGGGVEAVAGELARALGRRGHDVHLTGAAFDVPSGLTNVTPVPLSGRDPLESVTGLPMPLVDRAGRRRLDSEVQKADAVIIHDALYASSQLARRYAVRHRKPWIIIQHIGVIPYPNPVLRQAMAIANNLFTRRMLEASAQVVFISDAVRRHFGNLAFTVPPKVLFNGIDREIFFPPDSKQVTALRLRFGLSPERRCVLFVGRFVQRKGLAVLRALAAQLADMEFFLVGSGPIAPQDWNLTNVHVIGRLSRYDLAELYRAADALVLPSVGEGFPLVVQEAMATGLPIVCGIDSASADPAASSFVCGIEVDLGNPQATADRFAETISGMSFERRIAAADYARTTYDWDANARWIESRIDDLLSEA